MAASRFGVSIITNKIKAFAGGVEMPVFIFLVFVFAAVLWVLLSFAFRPLGRLVGRVWKDAKDAMDEEDPNEENTVNNNKEDNTTP